MRITALLVAFIGIAVCGCGTIENVVGPGTPSTDPSLNAPVLIYGGVGVYSLLRGKPFLDYTVLSSDPVHGQHYGVLIVELGVGITVFSIVLAIFYALSGRKRQS